MGLSRISRELQFEVCICGEPSVSPQSARAGEHFYRWEEEVGRALTESMAFHCLRPCQERRAVLLLPVGAAVVVTSCIKLSEAFYWGPHGITRALCGGDDCCCDVWGYFVLFRASLTLSASQGGVLSRSSPHFPEANTESFCGWFTVI